MNKHGGSSPDVSTLSIPLKSSTASQTDLRGEVGISSNPVSIGNNLFVVQFYNYIFREKLTIMIV